MAACFRQQRQRVRRALMKIIIAHNLFNHKLHMQQFYIQLNRLHVKRMVVTTFRLFGFIDFQSAIRCIAHNFQISSIIAILRCFFPEWDLLWTFVCSVCILPASGCHFQATNIHGERFSSLTDDNQLSKEISVDDGMNGYCLSVSQLHLGLSWALSFLCIFCFI